MIKIVSVFDQVFQALPNIGKTLNLSSGLFVFFLLNQQNAFYAGKLIFEVFDHLGLSLRDVYYVLDLFLVLSKQIFHLRNLLVHFGFFQVGALKQLIKTRKMLRDCLKFGLLGKFDKVLCKVGLKLLKSIGLKGVHL